MSRNLTDCYFCGATPKLDEEPRLCTPEDCGGYFEEYEGMLVAKATCPDCLAKYLAWVDMRGCKNPEHKRWAPFVIEGQTHFDLSFRSTFDDEPGLEDMPRYQIATRRFRVDLFTKNHWLEWFERYYPEKHAEHMRRLSEGEESFPQALPEES